MSAAACDERVLIVAPAGRDGHLLADAVVRARMSALPQADLAALIREMDTGVGAVVLTEEACDAGGVAALRRVISAQPAWSDLPILMLMSSRTPLEDRAVFASVTSLGNVTMLHRPVRMVTFLSAVRSALRTRKRQYEIRQYLEQLQEGARAKDEFLAMLGHELRNPLAAVRNAVATASVDESRRARALEIARRQTNQLGRLIDDLLDVARITQGRITLQKERLSIAEVLNRAIDTVRPVVDERGHQLALSLPATAVLIDADAARMEQVIVNLLMNAAKYTPPGGVLDVFAEREDHELLIGVRDTGIGIAPEVLPRVFDLFRQGDQPLDRAQGGLGIGLTVAKRLVGLHGGRLDIRSAGVGKGVEVDIRIPALPAAPDPTPATPAERGPASEHRARVLIVEDNSDAAESLAMLLELHGHQVRVAYDGLAALDAASADVPDVMLIDIGLPGVDGYEVARRISRDPLLKSVVLVALTGYGTDDDRQRALAAGFGHHLVKPIDLDVLNDLIARLGADAHSESAILQ